MKKGLLVAVIIGFCAMLLAGTASPGYGQVIGLKFSNFFPAPHMMSQLADQWCKEVEKRTNGKVKVSYYPGATLTPANQTYDSVMKGIADIGMADFSYTRGRFPLMEVIYLPLGYKSAAVATGMVNGLYAKFHPKELDDVKLLYIHAHGPGILHTKKPVEKLEDLKGMKIRSTGFTAKIVQTLGSAPVGMPMTESYDALSKGVADGIVCPYEAMKGWKLGEVVKYHTEDYGTSYTSGFFVAMNKQKWNSLPPDVQKVFDEVSKEWIGKTGKAWDDIDKEGKQVVMARGNKIIVLSAQEQARWVQVLKPLFDEYVKVAKEKNVPGAEALKFCQDYLTANQK
jgi:TRAP-type C4-dicarboxylate transport system substrate-binding protein